MSVRNIALALVASVFAFASMTLAVSPVSAQTQACAVAATPGGLAFASIQVSRAAD